MANILSIILLILLNFCPFSSFFKYGSQLWIFSLCVLGLVPKMKLIFIFYLKGAESILTLSITILWSFNSTFFLLLSFSACWHSYTFLECHCIKPKIPAESNLTVKSAPFIFTKSCLQGISLHSQYLPSIHSFQVLDNPKKLFCCKQTFVKKKAKVNHFKTLH